MSPAISGGPQSIDPRKLLLSSLKPSNKADEAIDTGLELGSDLQTDSVGSDAPKKSFEDVLFDVIREEQAKLQKEEKSQGVPLGSVSKGQDAPRPKFTSAGYQEHSINNQYGLHG